MRRGAGWAGEGEAVPSPLAHAAAPCHPAGWVQAFCHPSRCFKAPNGSERANIGTLGEDSWWDPPVQPPAGCWMLQKVTQSCALGVQPVLLLFGDKSHRLHPYGGPGGLAVAAGGRWQCRDPPPCSPATWMEQQQGAHGCLPPGLQNPALFLPLRCHSRTRRAGRTCSRPRALLHPAKGEARREAPPEQPTWVCLKFPSQDALATAS